MDSAERALWGTRGRKMESNKTRRKIVAKALAFASISVFSAWAQPTPAPTTGDLACKEESAIVPTDTVVSAPDDDGYLNLFDGTFKGWFQSCKTGHSSSNRSQGAIFRLGTADGKPAIYSTQRGSSGGVMMTNKKFANYEILIDFWPDYGNDGGLFNRTTIDGVCFQTVLDYIGGGSVGGMWAEAGYSGNSRDFRPWTYNGESSLGISGTYSWTTTTQKLKASTEPNIPCAASGCTQADYLKLWDVDGWNQIKVQFYAGLKSGSAVHMKSWFKKPADKVWVPIIQDTTLNYPTPAGYIGLQVHGGGRFGGPKGNWYRTIKWKPIDEKDGKPLPGYEGGVSSNRPGVAAPDFKLTASASVITGTIDKDYSITVRDISGRKLETFSGKAGAVEHPIATSALGVLFLDIKTASGVQSARVVRTTP
jgi:hypothetical protein